MRRYKYIGRDGSSGYRTGKKYWAFKPDPTFILGVEEGWRLEVYFLPFNPKRKSIRYINIERFKADWE